MKLVINLKHISAHLNVRGKDFEDASSNMRINSKGVGQQLGMIVLSLNDDDVSIKRAIPSLVLFYP